MVADEQRCECDATALATAQVADPGVPGDVGGEARDDVADLRVAGPFVFVESADDRLADRLLVVEGVRLVEDADGDAVPHGHAAGVRLGATGEEAEERRLAVAVPADDADAIALVHPDRDAVEDDFGRVLKVEGLSAQEMCHIRTTIPARGEARSPAAP